MLLAGIRGLAPSAAVAGGSPAATLAPESGSRRRRVADLPLTALLIAVIVLPLALAAERTYLSFGTETDYLSLFVPEAKRLLAGDPLTIAFHPPLYSAVIALAWSVIGDWFKAGLAVSLLAAGATAIMVRWLIDRLFGRAATLGALVALMTSAPFLAHAAQASSDLLFLALYTGACALALAGVRSGREVWWLALGLVVGLALLTRTNALTLMLLLFAPFLRVADPGVRRARGAALAFTTLVLPLSLWFHVAGITGSPPWPTSNHVNLAMTYFATGADRTNNDGFVAVAGRFDGFLEVLAYDPARVLQVYFSDLLTLARDRMPELVAFPFGLLTLPGLLYLPARRRSCFVGLFALVTLGQVLLVNFKSFEARYSLFLLPWLGAGLGVMLAQISPLLPTTRPWRAGQRWALAAGTLIALGLAVDGARTELHRGAGELAEAVPAAAALVRPDDLVVARKPHLARYLGARFAVMPKLQDAPELRAWLCTLDAQGRVFVYYGQIERTLRASLHSVLAAEPPPPWLQRVVTGTTAGAWTLHLRRHGACSGGGIEALNQLAVRLMNTPRDGSPDGAAAGALGARSSVN